MKLKSLALVLAAAGMAAGCSSYYQVRDPQSGNVYYTRAVNERVGGAVSFEDELTGRDVTLQQSEVVKIDRDSYRSRTARLSSDRDVSIRVKDVEARPAGARNVPNPDRQIEIRTRDLDDDDDIRIEVEP